MYEKGECTLFHSLLDFPVDPIKPYIDRVAGIKERIGYFVTPYFNYYGIVNADEATLVIGPSRLTDMSDSDVRELAFACDVEGDDVERFRIAMKSLVHMPIESIVS